MHTIFLKHSQLLMNVLYITQLHRWADAVRDYEVVRVQLPGDDEIVESLLKAQSALKKFHEDDMKFSGEVEKISSVAQFKAAVSSSSHGKMKPDVGLATICNKYSRYSS